MSLVKIPFLDVFRPKMLANEKWATSRSDKYGEVGDRFYNFGATFEILELHHTCVCDVAENWHVAEGFETPAQFWAVWKKIHRRKGDEAHRMVWLHVFKMVEATGPEPRFQQA